MRIKLDENLPVRLSVVLRTLQHDVQTVADENLTGCCDQELWEATQGDSRFLITQDLDFSDVRRFTPGTHHGVLLVRLRWPDRESLIRRVGEIFQFEYVSRWTGCFVVATDRKLRVVHPSVSPRD